jgi:branched-chain amino acid transport system ATP-binding protein
MTVEDNLTLGAYTQLRKGNVSFIKKEQERISTLFPVLKERRRKLAGTLSGGEQQMLAIARILTMDLKLILLDEPTEGLAPLLVREIDTILREIRRTGITRGS